MASSLTLHVQRKDLRPGPANCSGRWSWQPTAAAPPNAVGLWWKRQAHQTGKPARGRRRADFLSPRRCAKLGFYIRRRDAPDVETALAAGAVRGKVERLAVAAERWGHVAL